MTRGVGDDKGEPTRKTPGGSGGREFATGDVDARRASDTPCHGLDLSRRHLIGGIGSVAAAGLTVGNAGAQEAGSDVPTPTVDGPLGDAGNGRPQTGAPFDVGEYGYVEEEYVTSGEARHDDYFLDGERADRTASYTTRVLVYRPQRPSDFNGAVYAEWLNVTGQVDATVAWANGYDSLMDNGTAVALVSAQKAGVDGSLLGGDLVSVDAERYGDVSHPGDEYALDIFAQAIRALDADGGDGSGTSGESGGLTSGTSGGSGWWDAGQRGGTGRWNSDRRGGSGGLFGSGGGGGSGLFGVGLLGTGRSNRRQSGASTSNSRWWDRDGPTTGGNGSSPDPHPLGDLDAETLLATGHSQSSFYLLRYINVVAPEYGLVDGFLPGGSYLTTARSDVAPVLWLNSEGEIGGFSSPGEDGGGLSGDSGESGDNGGDLLGGMGPPQSGMRIEERTDGPRDDDGLFVLWEVAGAAHANYWMSQYGAAATAIGLFGGQPIGGEWDPGEAGQYGERPDATYDTCDVMNYFPMRYAWRAALERLRVWAAGGDEPPRADRIERTTDEEGTVRPVRDEHGNAKGGLRLPVIDVPVATYEGSACDLTGRTSRLDEATLADLYASNSDYVDKLQEACAQAVDRGHLRQPDAADLVGRAEESPVGEASAGASSDGQPQTNDSSSGDAVIPDSWFDG